MLLDICFMSRHHKHEYKKFACIPEIGKHRVIDREIVNVSHFDRQRPQIVIVNQPQIVVAIPRQIVAMPHQIVVMPRQIVAMPRQIVAIHRHP